MKCPYCNFETEEDKCPKCKAMIPKKVDKKVVTIKSKTIKKEK